MIQKSLVYIQKRICKKLGHLFKRIDLKLVVKVPLQEKEMSFLHLKGSY